MFQPKTKPVLYFILLFTILSASLFGSIVFSQTESAPDLHPEKPVSILPAEILNETEKYQDRLQQISDEQESLKKRIEEGQEELKTEAKRVHEFLTIEEVVPEEFKPLLKKWRIMLDSYRDVLKEVDATIDEVNQIRIRSESQARLFRLKEEEERSLLSKNESQLSEASKKELKILKETIKVYDQIADQVEETVALLGKNRSALSLSLQICEKNDRLLNEKWQSIRFVRFKLKQSSRFSFQEISLAIQELFSQLKKLPSIGGGSFQYYREISEDLRSTPSGIFVFLIGSLFFVTGTLFLRKKSNQITDSVSGQTLLEKYLRETLRLLARKGIWFLPVWMNSLLFLTSPSARQTIGWLLFASLGVLFALSFVIWSFRLFFVGTKTATPLLSLPLEDRKTIYQRMTALSMTVALFLLLELVSSLSESESQSGRLIKWIFKTFIFGIVFILIRQIRKNSLKWQVPPSVIWILRLAQLSLGILIFLTIGMGAFGYSYFSDYLADATLSTLLLIPLLLFLKKGVTELIQFRLFVQGGTRFKVNAELLFQLKKTIHQWSVVATWGIFLFGMARAWDLVPELIRLIHKILEIGFKIGNLNITIGLILSVFLVFYFSILFSRVLRAILERNIYPHKEWDQGIRHALNKGLHYSIMLIGLIIALRFLGFDLQNITVIAGALGVGLGFGLQNLANNFASGIVLLVERPVKVGDIIQVNNLIGKVKQIGARSTSIETGDQATILIPNGELLSAQVTNWTYSNSMAGVPLLLSVGYKTDLNQVKKLLLDIAKKNSNIVENPPPRVDFKGFGESSIDLIFRVWVKDVENKGDAQNEIYMQVLEEFRREGIEIPYPHREILIRTEEEK